MNEHIPAMQETSSADICKVAFRPPAFWDKDPLLWFAHVESQFKISGISCDSTKFHAIVSVLDPCILKYVRDIVVKPPNNEAYGVLKERLIAHFEQSEGSRLRVLLNELQLGDQRPSQLLCEMENLNSGKLGDSALRALWLQRLPLHIQQILSACSDDSASNSKLAKIADTVFEVSHTNAAVSSIGEQSAIGVLRAEIAEIKTALQSLKPQTSVDSGRSRQRNRQRFRKRSNSRSKSRSDLCWYHDKFKDKAHKCVQPCKWSEN